LRSLRKAVEIDPAPLVRFPVPKAFCNGVRIGVFSTYIVKGVVNFSYTRQMQSKITAEVSPCSAAVTPEKNLLGERLYGYLAVDHQDQVSTGRSLDSSHQVMSGEILC